MPHFPYYYLILFTACASDNCGKHDTGSPDTSDSGDSGDTALCEAATWTYDVSLAPSSLTMDEGSCGETWSSDVTGDGYPDLVTRCSDDTNLIVDPTTISPGANVISKTDHTWFTGGEGVYGCDLNGDGYGDIISTTRYLTGYDDTGWTYYYGFDYRLAYGPVEPTADGIRWDAGFDQNVPETDQQVFLDCIGDMDGDGLDTFLFEFYVWEGSVEGLPEGLEENQGAFLHEGPAETLNEIFEGSEAWFASHALSMGKTTDLNGDGFLDIVWNSKSDGSDYVKTEVRYGPLSGDLESIHANITLWSAEPGYHVDAITDWDQDGYGDLFGTPHDFEDGLALVPSPSAGPTSADFEDQVVWRLAGTGSSGYIYSKGMMTEVDDANGDGRIEVLVRNSLFGGTWEDGWSDGPGRAWLVEAPGEGVQCLDDVATVIYGSSNGETLKLGSYATGDIDLDLDGQVDLLLWSSGGSTILPSAGL